MADDKKRVYDESKVKTLSSLEHIRLRTGMYIGRIGNIGAINCLPTSESPR
jgi:DNA gyrase/topoisomerase IV subunit B